MQIYIFCIPLRPFKGFSSEYKLNCRHYMVWEKHKWSAFSLFSLFTSNAQVVPLFFFILKPGTIKYLWNINTNINVWLHVTLTVLAAKSDFQSTYLWGKRLSASLHPNNKTNSTSIWACWIQIVATTVLTRDGLRVSYKPQGVCVMSTHWWSYLVSPAFHGPFQVFVLHGFS